MTARKPMKGCIAVLKAPTSVPALIIFIRGIIALLTNNVYFPSQIPPLASLIAHLAELENAQTDVATRAPGTAEHRDFILSKIFADLRSLRSYIQGVADSNPTDAIAIITSAGLKVKEIGSKTKARFAVKYLQTGTLRLIAKSAGDRSANDWHISNDGNTWTSLTPTLQSKTIASELTPGNNYYFRHRYILKKGPSDWSQIIQIIAL